MSNQSHDPTAQARRIGRYEVLGEIASGGMATVFLARSFGAKGFSRLVAIKRLHPHLESEDDFVQMFLDEARLAARIRHPNVVATLDVEDSDGLYIVMEYIEGVTLLTLSRTAARLNERMPVPVIVRMVLDVLSGLQAAHELLDDEGKLFGLVHRDVSPQNILLGTDGTARITDFGIAKATSRLTHTRDGQLKGKISYMAPEQTRRVEIDRRVDVFAMGIVAWELFAGKRLFSGDSDVEVLNHLLFEPIPKLREHATALPTQIEQVVMKSLEREPAGRFASAHEFADALENAAKILGGPANHRTVAAFIQKVAGERITRERGRIASGSPPGDGNGTGSHRALEGTGTPSRVRNAVDSPAVDPIGSPMRPASSPLSQGRYTVPATGSGPRKATLAGGMEGLPPITAPRQSPVRAPTMAGPVLGRNQDPLAPPRRMPAPPPNMAAFGPGARVGVQTPAEAPGARTNKTTMMGVGNLDSPAVSNRPNTTPGSTSLAFESEGEFDEEMPTIADTQQRRGNAPGRAPVAPVAQRPPQIPQMPPSFAPEPVGDATELNDVPAPPPLPRGKNSFDPPPMPSQRPPVAYSEPEFIPPPLMPTAPSFAQNAPPQGSPEGSRPQRPPTPMPLANNTGRNPALSTPGRMPAPSTPRQSAVPPEGYSLGPATSPTSSPYDASAGQSRGIAGVATEAMPAASRPSRAVIPMVAAAILVLGVGVGLAAWKFAGPQSPAPAATPPVNTPASNTPAPNVVAPPTPTPPAPVDPALTPTPTPADPTPAAPPVAAPAAPPVAAPTPPVAAPAPPLAAPTPPVAAPAPRVAAPAANPSAVPAAPEPAAGPHGHTGRRHRRDHYNPEDGLPVDSMVPAPAAPAAPSAPRPAAATPPAPTPAPPVAAPAPRPAAAQPDPDAPDLGNPYTQH